MAYVIQPREQVKIIEPGHDYEGKYAYITGISGDRDSLNDFIPPGWVEVRLQHEYHELFRETHVIPAHLTL